MRLFDRFTNDTFLGRAARDAGRLKDAVLLDAQNIWSYLDEKAKVGYEWKADDYPFAIPPWKRSFVSATLPRDDWSVDIGAYVESFSKDEFPAIIRNFKKNIPGLHIHEDMADSFGKASYALMMHFMSSVGGKIYGVDFLSSWVLLDQDGLVIDEAYVPHSEAKECIDVYNDFFAQESFTTMMVMNTKLMSLMAFTYVNCKNITLQPVVEPDSHELKKRRRWKTAENKEYTLQISKVQYANDSERKDPQGIMPEHLCRGHFAHYTDEKKLFGKYTGRFWHPPHMRGKKENGTIKKDYSIPS